MASGSDAGLGAGAGAVSGVDAVADAVAGTGAGTGAGAATGGARLPGVPRRTLVMGILNVTEDSFSDGGSNPDTETAVKNALRMIEQGADIIDIGGESTRPGATRVEAHHEEQRVVSVIAELRDHPAVSGNNILLSVDTMRASTARAAVEAGAHIINDVSGGLADEEMLEVAAQTGALLCLMHWKTPEGTPEFTGAQGAADHGDDVVAHVQEWLQDRADEALAAGIAPENLILDPGIGFAKTPEENWTLLGATKQFTGMGFPVLIGASRKRFLAALHPREDGQPSSPREADEATAALSALSAQAGAWAVRVHDVAASRAAVDVAYAVASGTGEHIAEDWRNRLHTQ